MPSELSGTVSRTLPNYSAINLINNMHTTDKEFLEYVIKSLVNNPDDVKVERRVDEMGVLLSLHVNPMDMGQVIGRSGATAKALRLLAKIVGVKNDARVNIKIEEPEEHAQLA